MRGEAWQLGWWAPASGVLGGAGSADPSALIDPGLHGALLAAVAAGSPLDRLGQSRLTALKEAGLVTADGRPRFPVAPASQAKAVRAALAGPGGPTAAFLVVGGLLLDLGVRRLLRRQGLAAPPFGGAYVWLAEGEPGAAGSWTARSTALPGRGSLVRFGRRESPAWDTVAADPEAAPALPAAREPQLRELIEGLGWSVVRLVEDAIPGLDPLRRRTPGADDEGAFLAWAYALALDVALERLAARGLVAPPAAGVVAVRVADPALAGA